MMQSTQNAKKQKEDDLMAFDQEPLTSADKDATGTSSAS